MCATGRSVAFAPLSRRFFDRDVVALARALLGCALVHDAPDGLTAGRIVETEAYDEGDPASHSARGPTPRNRAMFGPAGRLYVYFSYGAHYCANVVAGEDGRGAAVLLRALEPLVGLEVMARRRGVTSPRLLCRGPGRLAQALGIDMEHYGVELWAPPLFIAAPEPGARRRILSTPRVGISKAVAVPWRFLIAANRFASR